MKLSTHFSLREMISSGTAIRQGIDNRPTEEQTESLRRLCVNVLEPLRERFGVIRISSGFRTERLNEAVGGVRGSQHTRGEAADIHVSDMEVGMKMYDFIRHNLDFDQLLFEHKMGNGCRWLHVSFTVRRQNRRQAMMMRA